MPLSFLDHLGPSLDQHNGHAASPHRRYSEIVAPFWVELEDVWPVLDVEVRTLGRQQKKRPGFVYRKTNFLLLIS